MKRSDLTGVGLFVLAAAAVFLLPRFISDFRAQQFAYVGIYFIALLGLNVLTGYTGLISLGHGAFMAIGGYTTAILVSDQGLKLAGHTFSADVKDIWTIPLAGLVAGLAGFAFGFPALRLTGLYLALATFAIAVAMPGLLKYDRFEQFTGGGGGINLFESAARTRPLETTDPITFETIAEPIKFLGLEIGSFNEWLYYLCWALALLMFAIAWLFLRGKSGRSFRAVRDSELAAASSGVNLATYKTLAFGISAFYAGVAGSLLAIATTFVNPDTYPDHALDLPARRRRRRGPRLALAARVRRDLHPVPAALGAGGLEGAGGAGGGLRRHPDSRDDHAPGRRRRPDSTSPSVYKSRLPSRSLSRSLDFKGAAPTMRRPRLLLCLLALAGAIATGATAATSADPGVSAKTILVGGTTPLSGTASAYASVARGANAYFKYVNSRGGVNGRTITYKTLDDAYDPGKTVQATKQLVEQDKVFAIFNSLGTEQNLATRDYLNAAKVPQLFVASGATTFGRDFKKYPWTIGFQPSYRAEGWIYGKYLARTKPGAKVAVLVQNDDYGKDLLAGLKQGIARSKVKVVAAQSFEVTDPDVQSQIARLKASGANVLALFATPRHAIQGYVFANRLGWRPLIINNAVSSASNIMTLASEGGSNKAVENSISIVFLKDPTDAKWRNDAAVKLYRSIMSRFAKGANQKDVYHVYGMAVGLRVRQGAEGRRQEPDPDGRDGADGEAERPVEPLPAPGADGEDERDGALPDRAGAAAALVEGELEELRRPLGVPSGIGSTHARRAARRSARGGARAAARRRPRHLLAEGLHPADDALPRRLRLLHLRPAAAPRRAGLPARRGGAGDRPGRRRRRLHRGALHARRQAGAALQGRPSTSSPSSAVRRRSSTSAGWRSSCSMRRASCRT